MLKESEFWLLTVLLIIAATLTAANMVLFQGNRTAQTEISGRQQFIQQSTQLEGLYREIVKALADLAVRSNDAELATLLGAQGISIKPNNPPSTDREPKKEAN